MPKLKIVLDGALFAECGMRGANRDGMMRVAEGLTEYFVKDPRLDINFAGTVKIEKYNRYLKQFISQNYRDHVNKIFSRKVPELTNILKRKEFFRTHLNGVSFCPYFKKLDEYDLFHSFYYPFPKQVLRNHIKHSITYHDIIPLVRAGYPADLIDRTRQVVRSIKKGHAIAVSEYSKQDLLNYDKEIDSSRISVVPLAASKKLFYPVYEQEELMRVKNKYSLPENYFLCVSGNDSRKNIPHVIKSFSRFILEKKNNDIHLLLTGNMSHSRQMLDDLNIPKVVKDKIFIPSGFIDSDDLAAIYSASICFFFMSLYEGFGLPVLEAMQCGVPVVTADTTSLPEVVGNAGICIPPTDENSLASVMEKISVDSSMREKYSKASLQRASFFSWEKSANLYVEIFDKICKSGV